ncbi:MAG: hypothetical protein Q8Q09_13955 [Deltaproteobacteria bacterium]|nr:hypothetical protein [Deltaproteobacteria bacterium]
MSLRRLAPALCIALGFLGCVGSNIQDASIDGASGDVAGPRDARIDSARSDVVRQDAGRDEAALAAQCAEISATPERWQRLPFACECDARMAHSPELAAPPIQWRACTDRADCLDMVDDWRNPRSWHFTFEFLGHEIDGQLWIAYRREGPANTRDLIVVSHVDGPPVAAWEVAPFAQEGCWASDISWGGSHLGMSIWRARTQDRLVHFVLTGPPSNDPVWRERVVEMDEPRFERALIPYFTYWNRSVATTLGTNVYRNSAVTGRMESLASAAELRGEIAAVQIIENQTWFMLTEFNRATGMYDDDSLWVIENNLPARRMYHPTGERRFAGYKIMGEQILLFERSPLAGDLQQREYEHLSVAQRTVDPAAWAPRNLWTMPLGAFVDTGLDVQFGGGWIAFASRMRDGSAETQLILLRLSDGARFEPDPGERVYNVDYVTADEVAYARRVRERVRVRRLRIRGLGTPIPPT